MRHLRSGHVTILDIDEVSSRIDPTHLHASVLSSPPRRGPRAETAAIRVPSHISTRSFRHAQWIRVPARAAGTLARVRWENVRKGVAEHTRGQWNIPQSRSNVNHDPPIGKLPPKLCITALEATLEVGFGGDRRYPIARSIFGSRDARRDQSDERRVFGSRVSGSSRMRVPCTEQVQARRGCRRPAT